LQFHFFRCRKYRSFSISSSEAIAIGARISDAGRRFLLSAGAVALFLCLATAAANVVIDPYGLYRLVDVRGFNKYKPEKYPRVRLMKAFALEDVKPRAIVLGTSRSHIAIRMTHPAWAAAAIPRYNLAFDGATTHEMYAYLLHTQAIQPLKQVVIGLDTWQLGTAPSGVRPDFDPTLLEEPGHWAAHLRSALSRLRVAFSLDGALASLRTARGQDVDAQDWFADDGQRLGDIFFHRSDDGFSAEGQGSYFAAVDREEAGFKLDMGPPMRPRPGSVTPPPDLSSLEYVQKIVAFCRENGIDLRIFITPAHAHQNELSIATGEWSKVENGKRALVHMLAEDAAKSAAEPFPLWDFSGYSSVTTESVPAPGERREMTFYWDSSHFKEEVGDWVLDRLFGDDHSAATKTIPDDFGVRLTANTIEAELDKIRADRNAYLLSNARDVAEIRALVADVYRHIPVDQRVPLPDAPAWPPH